MLSQTLTIVDLFIPIRHDLLHISDSVQTGGFGYVWKLVPEYYVHNRMLSAKLWGLTCRFLADLAVQRFTRLTIAIGVAHMGSRPCSGRDPRQISASGRGYCRDLNVHLLSLLDIYMSISSESGLGRLSGPQGCAD